MGVLDIKGDHIDFLLPELEILLFYVLSSLFALVIISHSVIPSCGCWQPIKSFSYVEKHSHSPPTFFSHDNDEVAWESFCHPLNCGIFHIWDLEDLIGN